MFAVSELGADELFFYEAAVQVIPTLLVALAIEGRAFGPQAARDGVDRSFAVGMLIAIFLAETIGLGTLLGTFSPAGWIETLISITIGAELGVMILVALRAGGPRRSGQGEPDISGQT